MSDTPIYIEVAVKVQPLEPFRDIFIAQLGTLGFESFSETAEGFEAYIIKEDFDEAAVKGALLWEGVQTSFATQEIEQVNWNAEWENNFDPIEVDGRVYIRAPFHEEKQGFEYPMLIEPKMSFGTGHHQTTHMMINGCWKPTLQVTKCSIWAVVLVSWEFLRICVVLRGCTVLI